MADFPGSNASPQSAEVELGDGARLSGTINTFNPQQPSFFLHTSDGARRLDFAATKRVDFLRPDGVATNPTFAANAQLVTVRFHDRSTVEGIAESGGPARRGIFLVPTGEPRVERCYLPFSAVLEMVSVKRLGEILVDQRMATRAMVEEALARQKQLQDEPLGEILLRHRRIDAAQLEKSLEVQRERRQSRIGEILIEHGFATRAEVDLALEQQRAQRSRRLGDILIELGYASAKAIGIALALQHNLDFVSLAGTAPDPQLKALVPHEFVERWGIVPHTIENGVLVVAVVDPAEVDFKPELQQRAGLPVTEIVVTPQDLARAREVFLAG